MWHGSAGDRWHSIVRNGLMNMSNRDCVHGTAHGPGIYLASCISTSLGYTTPVQNLYRNSMFGLNLTCIALCEVVPVKKFNDFGNIATLQDESALVVRFIFPITDNNSLYGYGCCYTPSISSSALPIDTYIPTLADVLRHMGGDKSRKDASFNDNRYELDYGGNSNSQSNEKQGKNKKRNGRRSRK